MTMKENVRDLKNSLSTGLWMIDSNDVCNSPKVKGSSSAANPKSKQQKTKISACNIV